MDNFLRILASAIFFVASTVVAQDVAFENPVDVEWLERADESFVKIEESVSGSVIYLNVRVPHSSGKELLLIRGISPFTLFINNKLVMTGRKALLPLDSLSRIYASSQLLVAVHQDGLNRKTLTTQVVNRKKANAADVPTAEIRPSYALRDFSVIGALLLSVLVASVIRLNPKLASDYFSFPKIFSFREDDSQLNTRIGSSTNIIFYVYCSMLLGYFMIIILQFVPDHYRLTIHFGADSFGELIIQWSKLSGIIFILLILKIIIIMIFSYLFGISEFGGIHFFNWVRLLIVFFGALTLFLFVYFISHGNEQNMYVLSLKLVAWLLGGWIILIFLKLSSKSGGSLFHLFSYICATELIPFLFIIKVLYN
jgi:hypothetical protein